ncbi:MAG: extracellular solute-binding protein [Lachnospiraceae bacterium]|jgi:multiple sugar transport system substrate-binding protein|nr:extracellular solute-binding protein [Lachnospiraceae bacterium]
MKKKFMAAITAAAVAAAALAGCGSGSGSGSKASADGGAASAEAPTEPFGDTIKYDPSVAINDGKDITVELWEWGSDELFQEIIDGYQAIHPNVTIKLVNNPWEDYWTKLPLALDGENGPALFNVHNSYHENLINYLAPLEISLEDLQADFTGVEAHVIDGKVYYIDYGMMTGSVYYNKDMWEAAGLTEGDIPKTWDEMREVAKKLTIKEGDRLIQAGLNFNDDFHQNYLLGLNYQLGENLFLEDGRTPNVTSDAMKKTMQMLVDLYKVDGVGSENFGEKGSDSFGQGQSAMVIQWGHYYNTLNTTWTDINFGVFEIPTFDGNPYAYNRYNGESTFGINKNASAEQQAVAQDFVKYFLANDDAQIAFNLAMSTFPAKKSLADSPAIMENPSLSVLAEHIDHYIWPGPMPSTMETSLKKAGQDIFFNGVDIDTALNEAQETIIRDMKSSTFQSVEHLYKYAK